MKELNFWISVICLILLEITAGYALHYRENNLLLTRQIEINKLNIAAPAYGHVTVFKYRSPIAFEDFDKKTSPYGYRELLNQNTGGTRTSEHKGLDFVGTWHCLIRPIDLNGEVIDVWMPPNWYYKGHPTLGGYARIKHNDNWISGYPHLSAIYVREGDLLINGIFYRDGKPLKSKGSIGRQGNTGLSWGEHLHLSIQKPDGTFADPLHHVRFP